jgi:hypothetical protein
MALLPEDPGSGVTYLVLETPHAWFLGVWVHGQLGHMGSAATVPINLLSDKAVMLPLPIRTTSLLHRHLLSTVGPRIYVGIRGIQAPDRGQCSDPKGKGVARRRLLVF